MNPQKSSLAELAQSLSGDLNKLQEVLKKLNLELARLNLEYKWMLENKET